jgi:hypothetical protein
MQEERLGPEVVSGKCTSPQSLLDETTLGTRSGRS